MYRQNKSRVKRTKSTPLMKMVKAAIYPYMWGESVDGTPLPKSSKERFVQDYNYGYKKSLSNGDLERHFKGESTIYFWGSPFIKAPECLCMVDIDVQKSQQRGTAPGARAFAKHLQKGLLDGMPCEPSTKHKGQHGYIFITGGGDKLRRRAFEHLQDVLQAEARATAADIELVEVKGKPPLINYKKKEQPWDSPQIQSMIYGTNAKLPRTLTAEELAKAPRIHCFDILKMPIPKETDTKKERLLGSCYVMPKEYIDTLPSFRKMAAWLFPHDKWGTSGGTKVTEEDVAIALAIHFYFTMTMGEDKANPSSRWRKVWEALFSTGVVDRQWDNKRFAAIRNGLSRLGMILWHDETYFFYGGEDKKGKCCKWEGSGYFLEMAAHFIEGESQRGEAGIYTGSELDPEPPEPNERYLKPTPVAPAREEMSWLDPFEGLQRLSLAA